MLNLQDQSETPKTALQEPCAMSHEETLHVSTTACMEQNTSTQANMPCINSVQETESSVTTLVENHQTDSSAGPASIILSTMSSMKLRDIMDKMRSCLFGWSWNQVSLFNMTGKDTATVKPTVHIPCTAIVPARDQKLFFPCSLLEDTVNCNEKVEEFVAIPPQPSLTELELCLQLNGICDITARLCVVFRPECIVEVNCSILNFQTIVDGMERIGLPQPTRSAAATLAIMPPQTSAVQVTAAPETQLVQCDNHEVALDVTLLEDTVSCSEEVEEFVVVPPQPIVAELKLRLQLPDICDITARLCAVFRPECVVEVNCSILNFHADGMRRIGLPQPTRSTAATLAIMPPQTSAVQVAAASEAQLVEYDNHEITLDVNLLEDTSYTSYNQVEVVEFAPIPLQPIVAELELRLQLPDICDITARLCIVFRPEGIVEVDVSIVRFVAIADDVREIDFQLPIESILSSPEFMSLQQVVQPLYYDNDEKALEVSRPQTQQLDVHVFQEAGCSNPDKAINNTATTLDHDVMVNQVEESLEVHETTTEEPRWSQMIAECVYHDPVANFPNVDDQEVKVAETSSFPEGTLEARIAESEQKAVESMLILPQPSTAELELRLQLPDICDITARLCVVFRPEGIADVYVSILRFVAIADDLREIDFQLPIESILSSPEFMSLQQVAIMSEFQSVDYDSHKDALKTQQEEDHDIHHVENSTITTLTSADKAERSDIEEICSRLAFMSDHDIIQPVSKLVASKDDADLKGSEIFFGNAIQSEEKNHVPEKVTSGKDVTTTSEDHSSTHNSTTADKVYDIDELCSRLASINASLPASESTSCNTNIDFKGLELLLGKTIRCEDNNCGAATTASEKVYPRQEEPVEPVGVAPIESTEGFKPLSDVTEQSVEYQQTTVEGIPSRSATFVSEQCDLQQQQEEAVNFATPGLPSEGHQLKDDVSAVVPVNPAQEMLATEETVSKCTRLSLSVEELQHQMNVVVPSGEQLSDSVGATTVAALPTSNTLAELVTRGIKKIRKYVDVTGRRIENVPLEGSTEKARKRRHADVSNPLLCKDIEVAKPEAEVPITPSLEDVEEDKRELVRQRYPSDVHQALLTQTVDLLERGIVLLSDDGSFKATVNPSSVSRIGWALTGNNFSKTFKRYDNDVLPLDLKQKVVERAALVASEHQDRAFERLAERPIFTLSEIRHYDCNGDYIMEDISSPNIPPYPFTGIQPIPLHQCFVNPFQPGVTPQGLLTSGLHTPFQVMQQYQHIISDIEMIDADELHMDIEESIEDVFMECEDQKNCPYCSQISLNLFASLPTKYAISRRAIYSLLDERPLNPEIPSWRLKPGSKKSWFAYNTFSFRPEFDEPSGGLSRKDRVIYSVLDERPLNPVLSPSLTRQSNIKSWFAYNTFSFKEGDLVPIGSKCNCMQTENPFLAASHAAHTVPSTVELWPKLEQVSKPVFPCASSEHNSFASKSPFNTFSFSFADNNSQQASIFGESKQEPVFSFGNAEQRVPPSEPVTVSSEVSWKDFSFREEDDPKHAALYGESSFTLSVLPAEKDEPHETTKKQPTDLSFEPAEPAVDKETLTLALEQEEQPAFPVSDDSGSMSSETESHDEELFDLNDESDELAVKEIIDAVKSKLRQSNLPEGEEPNSAPFEGESFKDNKTPSEVEWVTKQGVVDGKNAQLKTTSEAKDTTDNTLVNDMGQSQAANHVYQGASQTAEQATSNNAAEAPSKLTISHSKSINKRTEPYPTKSGSRLPAFLRRRVKVVERDRLKSLQVSTQVNQVDEDDGSSDSLLILAEKVQQRRVVRLKSRTGNTETNPSSKHDLTITIAPSNDEDRKVVSPKSLTHDTKPDSPTSSSVAVPPVQSDVNSSNNKVSLKSLHQTKKEPDVKGSEMDRLMSRTQSKDSDALSKSTLSNDIEQVSVAQSDRAEHETDTIVSQPTVSSVAEKRGKVISLRSLIQSKKAKTISKFSSPESHGKPIQGPVQISKPVPEQGDRQLASLKSPTLRPRADSMSNSIPRLPLVSSHVENEVVSLNPKAEDSIAETSSKSSHSAALAASVVQKTNVVSLKSLTQGTWKKDEAMKNAVVNVPQVCTGMTHSKERPDVVKNKVGSLNPKIQCNKMNLNSIKEPAFYASPASSKTENSDQKEPLKPLEQPKTEDPFDSSPPKSLPSVNVKESRMVSLKSLTQGCKSEPRNKAAVSSPQVSTVTESSAKKVKTTEIKGKESALDKSSTSKVQASIEKNAKVVAIETASQGSCVAETGSARKVAFKSTHEGCKEDALIKSSASTANVSLDNAEMVSLKKELDSCIAESSCARAVPFTSKLQKKDARTVSSAEPSSELMSSKSVVKSEKEVPVYTSRVQSKVDDDQHSVSKPLKSVKRKSFQSLTSPHKRELDEMMEEDQLSDMERLRKFNSRRRKPSSGKPRKANVKPKSVGNSGDDKNSDNNKNSEANVKLVKSDVVQDTSIAKRSSVTTKQLKPISLTVDTVKDESTVKGIPGTVEKTQLSPEGRVGLTDAPKGIRQGTSQESSLTSPAIVKTDDHVNVTSGSAVQSSPTIPNPNPLPAEVKMPNTIDTTPTGIEPTPRHKTETVGQEVNVNNTTESKKAKDSSEKSCLPEPEQSSSSMDLVKEPLCLAGVVAISGKNVINERIPEPSHASVLQPAAENVTLGKRKLQDMQDEDEDEEIPTVKTEKPVEVKKKRRWVPVEKPPENHEQQNKPRRIVRNKFKKA